MIMKALNPIDLIFLTIEKTRQPMHLAGLFIFKIPDDAQPNFVAGLLQQIYHSKIPPAPPFDQIVAGLTWKIDPNLDLDYHFHHVRFTETDRQQLDDYISQQHGIMLDRKKPLWTCHLIEGFDEQRFAVFLKIHHSLLDGVAGLRLIQSFFSTSAEDKHFVAPWTVQGRKKRTKKTTANHTPTSLFGKIKQLGYQQTQILPPTFKEIRHALFNERGKNPLYVSTTQAPKSILNQKITADRQIAVQSYNLNTLKKIATHFDVTLNDLILALCSGALRQYLQQHDQLPTQPLIAMVPMSLRQDQESSHGNQLTAMLANLATHLAQPTERLNAIQASMQYAKQRFQRMTAPQVFTYSAMMYAVAGAKIVSGLFPTAQPFNLIISNVVGTQQPLYWNGAMLEQLYPTSVLLDGQALNLTMTSYLDQLEISLVTCPQVVPNAPQILQYFADELRVFEALL